MTEKERILFLEVAVQVIDWMKEDWGQSQQFCSYCQFPSDVCDHHEEWAKRIEKLSDMIEGIKSAEKGSSLPPPAKGAGKTRSPVKGTTAPSKTSAVKGGEKRGSGKTDARRQPAGPAGKGPAAKKKNEGKTFALTASRPKKRRPR